MDIPLADLNAEYEAVGAEIDEAIRSVVESKSFVGGEFLQRFESEFAGFSGLEHGVGTSSGTTALQLALLACGVQPGDEVVTVPNTFIATAEAIVHAGATPVFCDVDPQTMNMNPERLREAITPRARAVLPVHLNGQPAAMDEISAIAAEHDLAVIEDAAHAHGAEFDGKPVGSFGKAACFSFYPAKNLGAYGDAGAVLTNDPEIAESVRMLRDHGRSAKYTHKTIGFNYRMDALQGAILSAKLRHLADWNANRRRSAAVYDELLAPIPNLTTPVVHPKADHVYHLYVVKLGERDALRTTLADAGIGSGVHYPLPLHLQPAFAYLGHETGAFPVTEALAEQIISLPMFPELTRPQIERVVAVVSEHCARMREDSDAAE